MIKHPNYNRGFIGLIALLIVVTIMAFIMIKQYETLWFTRSENESVNESMNESVNGSITDSKSVAPIERAQNIKNILETRDRSILNQ